MTSFFRRPRRGAPPDDRPALFGGVCPVCRAPLGIRVPIDAESRRLVEPPSLRLELTGDLEPAWRIDVVGHNFRPMASRQPHFDENEVTDVHLLCGNGHVFLVAAAWMRSQNGDPGPVEVDMTAVVGAPASGKTYLLLRTLNQDLRDTGNWAADDADRPVLAHQSRLERDPLDVRVRSYRNTLTGGAPIPATGVDFDGSPASVLSSVVPEAVDAIQDLVRMTTVDGERRAARWGLGFRQPLAIRTSVRGRRFWSGFADLPGELFAPRYDNTRERAHLRGYDALLWTVDPLLSPVPPDALLGDADFEAVLDGSLRPGTVLTGADEARASRERVQTDIGRALTLSEGPMLSRQGSRMSLHVAITKCDLLHHALRKNARLGQLGEPGAALRGAAGYLALLASRWAAGALDATGPGGELLSYVSAGPASAPDVRRARAQQVAAGLLDHYSDAEAFWRLVDGGAADEVMLPASDMSTVPYRLPVPSIGEHLESATSVGPAVRIELRDIVMSAVGAGVFAALGHEQTGFSLVREEWLRVRFFLCSALGKVPSTTAEGMLVPLDNSRFPRVDERSAGLTHLLLALLAHPLAG